MPNFTQLKSAMAAVIKQNGSQQITGQVLQNTLNSIIDTVGAHGAYAGIATPTTNPGNPDQNVFYIATTPGTYVNFNNAVVDDSAIVIYNKSGAWVASKLDIPTNKFITDSNWKKANSTWFNGLGGANLSHSIPNIDKITSAIKDIWFAFPNGVPSWWGTRQPQLRSIAGNGFIGNHLRIQFRTNQSMPNDDLYTIDYTGIWKGELELIKISRSMGTGEPSIDVYAIIDSTNFVNDGILLDSAQSLSVQPMIIPKTTCSENQGSPLRLLFITGKLSFDRASKILTIPNGTNIYMGANQWIPVKNSQIDFKTVQGSKGRGIFIYFDTNTSELSASNNEILNPVFGGDKILVGMYDDNISDIYIYGWKWESNGLNYGIDYIGNISSAKTIFGTSLQFNPNTWKISVIHASSRVIGAKSGSVTYLKVGDYNLLPVTGQDETGYRDIFIKSDGTIYSVRFINDRTSDFANSMWIGWIHTTENRFDFPNLLGNKIIDITKPVTEKIEIPQIFSSDIRRVELTKPLRLLCFGSSWFMNTWWYLNKIIQAAGINAELTCFYTGGATFQQWIDRYNANTSVDVWKSINGANWTHTTAVFKTTLQEGWDIIAFQQGAMEAIDWENKWENQWSKLTSIVKRNCGIDSVIAFNSTWTPAINGNLSPQPNTVAGQQAWQQQNYDNVKKFMALSGIYNISPNGATMWAMRRNTTLNTSNDLATDTLHPDNGLPMYGLAGTFYETYIAPMYNVSFNKVSWLPDNNTQKIPGTVTFMPITTIQQDLIRQIIKLSLSDRFGFLEI